MNCQNYLRPEEVNKMCDNAEVYVNRITINSRLIELGLSDKKDVVAEKILIKARHSIAIREKGKRIAAWGAKMKIKDVRKAFGNIEKMTSLSFKPCQLYFKI